MSDDSPLLLLASDEDVLLLVLFFFFLLDDDDDGFFFALVDGAVHTAADGAVLAGTVRRLLLEVCAREGVPVVLQPPKLADAGRWEGCLISSTSRLLLPVDELYVPADGRPSRPADRVVAFDNAPASLAARLRDMVSIEVEAHSSEIAL